jgi:hypothetical protein
MIGLDYEFVPGWHPDHMHAGYRRLKAENRLATVGDPPANRPPALSLSQYRLGHYEQGGVGSCWVHAAKQTAEVTAQALGYSAFSICRHLISYVGKHGGNGAFGGSPSEAIASMTHSDGAGIAHEDLDPYQASAGYLGSRPPQKVYDDAKASDLTVPVAGKTDLELIKRMIAAGHAWANGIWWPFGWDSHRTIMESIGGGTYGHALCVMGYAEAGIIHPKACLQLDNWHGLLYPPLSAEQASKVPGYKPIYQDKTSDFWVTEDIYLAVCNRGWAEHTTCTDYEGLNKRYVKWDFSESFVF